MALLAVGVVASGIFSASAVASSFSFSTGSPDGKMAMGSRPGSGGVIEIEAADDFTLEDPVSLTSATFTGLLPSMAPLSSIQEVRVEAYRVFPTDSDPAPTSGPPTFSTPKVPTRVNSPADTAFAERNSAGGRLSFTVSSFGSFAALNSVLNGIHPKPSQNTGGDGPVSGDEVVFDASFNPPLSLPSGHFFFVPQVELASGDFYWLSAPRPAPPPGTVDLQTWIRNADLSPDWLRVGSDIVGGGATFNGAFSLTGVRCATLSVSPSTLPDAVVGRPYSVLLSASGGVPPYSFGAIGALPSGLSLTSGGTLSGVPTNDGSFPVAVSVSDAEGCTGNADLTLAVHAGGSASPAAGSSAHPGTGSSATAPNTKITKTRIDSQGRTATFRFRAIGAASDFQCALTRTRHRKPKPKFRKCRSPKAYRRLKDGKYTFSVRALDSAGADPTPAKRRFRIRAA
jgi:hypothetical protein